MRIFESMEVAGSALTAHRLWMDTISSNLANINTTRTLAGGPYKRRVPVFAEMLDKTIGLIFLIFLLRNSFFLLIIICFLLYFLK